MPVNYAALKTEIDTDPRALGYAGKTDPEVADILNLVRATETLERETIPTYEVIEATVSADWAGLSATERTRYQTIVAAGTLRVRGTNTRAMLAAMFAAGTTTRANLLALQTRSASRAEVLFGAGVAVDFRDVGAARLMP